ncbi:hypothetical protein [Stutzerimonas kunmingensis]|jgi:hypothetical protein|uniref:hypothetical protein n=1 Tax=Stutzerimonas kunmingensis TaxID=1211807 RepID=UPI0028B13061|nr:hypothetical protein [Stutzerimonas kunmingensis]
MISEGDFFYADFLLTEWARWVKSEFVGTSLEKPTASLGACLDDETGLAVDMAIARCEDSVRKTIKRVYLWRDMSIDKAILRKYLSDFMRTYHREAA